MTTYLLRHASTRYSTAHRVNGDPTVDLPLDPEGRVACRTGSGVTAAVQPRIWLTSGFARTSETARLLMGETDQPIRVEPALGEVDYGQFEGGPFTEYARWLVAAGPWERPPGAGESQRGAILRMLVGLRSAVPMPSPRVVVAHGLLASVLRWQRQTSRASPGRTMPIFFDEVPCLYVIRIEDSELEDLTVALLELLEAEEMETVASGAWSSRPEDERVLATFDGPSVQLEEKNSHA
ncbi:histidine phosphatase family protein [Kitasatospora aureofaciens]|uniref:histidine phosphatase family protein n=1 Tax=Kitasatospora aureofaciens TaxID=1894 RepID=UPI001C45E11F|nr:histidine phosphatase family protein [Kitasatospora aureofaciens]MBV6701949.1 phosphoglycerate mutase family protein [Kitasatospora aureofaciens]